VRPTEGELWAFAYEEGVTINFYPTHALVWSPFGSIRTVGTKKTELVDGLRALKMKHEDAARERGPRS
jgi:hypothetical protein